MLRVNYDEQGLQTNDSGIDARLYLKGGADGDRYDIGLAGLSSARIHYDFRYGRRRHQLRLNVSGTDRPDFFLSATSPPLMSIIANGDVEAHRL